MDDFVPSASPRMGVVSDINVDVTKPIRKSKLKKNSSNSVTFGPETNFSQPSHLESDFASAKLKPGSNDILRDNSFAALTKGVHPWQRILYAKQAYRDNHYDPHTFFSHMTIVNYSLLSPFVPSQSMVRPVFYYFYTYSQAILHASLLVQQFSAVTFFLTIYQLIRFEVVTLEALWFLNIVALVTGSFVFFFLLAPSTSWSNSLFSKIQILCGRSSNRSNVNLYPFSPSSSSIQYNNGQNGRSFYEFIRVSILFVICLKIAAPVIRTLTSAVSEDTIYATAMILSGFHLLSHDYLPPVGFNLSSKSSSNNNGDDALHPLILNNSTATDNNKITNINIPNNTIAGIGSSNSNSFSSNSSVSYVSYSRHSSRTAMVSLSTGMFTAMMLASRLHTADLVVAFVIFAIITFTLFPIVCRMLLFHNIYLHNHPTAVSSSSHSSSSSTAIPSSANDKFDPKQTDKFGFYHGLQIILVLTQWVVTSRVLWLLDHPSVMKLYFPEMKTSVISNNSSTSDKRNSLEGNDSDTLQDGYTFFVIYQLLVVLLWLIAPMLFVWLQRFKQILRGAWDIPEVLTS